MLSLISVLVAIAALFGWVSARLLRLPNTIGTMLLTATVSISLVLLKPVWPQAHREAVALVGQINFERLILNGMLPPLLFAGASLLDLEALRKQKLAITLLAGLGTLLSIAGVSTLTYFATRLLGLHASVLSSLLFGALISPTDPIAVLEMLQRVRTPKYLEAQLGGESLFNDGVGAVIFLSLLAATHGESLSLGHLAKDVLLEAGGGIVLGVALAYVASSFMKNVQNAAVDVLISIALALGGYALANRLGISAPLETVTSALALRYMTAQQPAERVAHNELRHFWSMLDEIQNALLFVLLGCGFLVISFRHGAAMLGGMEIVIVSTVRVAAVALVLGLLRLVQPRQRSSLAVLSWGGLRGGLSIALALVVPVQEGDWILTVTYTLVVFSVLVQGSTMGMFLKTRSFVSEDLPATPGS